MAADPEPERQSFLRGKASLIIAVGVVAAVLIGLPAYRIFFAISVGIGVLFAGVIYLWHKYRPLKEEEINNKRPLGLN